MITTGLFSSGSRDHVGCFLFNDLIELFSIFMDHRAISTAGNNRSICEYYEKNYLSALVLYVQVGSLFAVFLVKRGFKVDLYEAREGNYHPEACASLSPE